MNRTQRFNVCQAATDIGNACKVQPLALRAVARRISLSLQFQWRAVPAAPG